MDCTLGGRSKTLSAPPEGGRRSEPHTRRARGDKHGRGGGEGATCGRRGVRGRA